VSIAENAEDINQLTPCPSEYATEFHLWPYMLLWQSVYTLGGVPQAPKIVREKPKEAIFRGRISQGKRSMKAQGGDAWV
jgi:hypothetical protein